MVRSNRPYMIQFEIDLFVLKIFAKFWLVGASDFSLLFRFLRKEVVLLSL